MDIQIIPGDVKLTAALLSGDSSETNIYVAIDRAVERSCSKVTTSDESRWPSFRHSGSIPFATNNSSYPAYGQDSA